ncbi:probable bifunctional dTTP/UTP pyrophosphatase/methyltransferase protein isoform X2 [Podarcis raffonei]|uniref:probable bifunctional dTTP/UTP pyrophosphatase/methyltransferase protein isoform X2 n=1 Tax=Podarcis raffonei TaxID=65483 RepID=UPI0023298871|nr:probable bifunctional dTTP/UTP pyrophosphatase/methyltransferase protein isoform X2 [Podarcis raffonei]
MVLNPVIGKLVHKRVVLASASPRRQEILTNAKHLRTPDVVIGADTIVTIEEQILEKPVDKQDAYRMLSKLSGKEHSVFTGVAIVHCSSKDNQLETEVTDFYEETKVKFSALSEELLWEYIHSGEPMDKAGGYGIQALGGMLVEYVHGDFLNVVGFPLNRFCKKLAELYYPPPKHTIHHIKHDSIPSVETFEILSDGECDSSDNHTQFEGVKKRNGGGAPHSLEKCIKSSHSCNTPVESQNGVIENATQFPAKLTHLLDGFRASKALFVASKLKVFDILKDKGTLTAMEAANKLKTSVCGTERLLDACTSLGLLDKNHLGYSNTDMANLYLASDGECSLHDYVLYCNDHTWPLYKHLELAVKEGTPLNQIFEKKAEDCIQDLCCQTTEAKQRFMSAMHSISKLTARDVAVAFDLSQFRAACDLGGCTGALAYELVHIYPEMKVTVFDLPEIITSVSSCQPSRQNPAQVSFMSGDFFKDNLPKGDLYILSRVLHDCSEEKISTLFSKIYAVCKPGSALLVAEIVLDEKRTSPARAVLQSLSMTEGKQRTGLEYKQLLEKHGFTNVQIKITGNLLDAILCFKKTSIH